MKYINDWEKRKKRHIAFWNREIEDRALITLLGPNANSRYWPDPVPEDEDEKLKYFTDAQWVLKRAKHMWENLTFVGDGFPQVILNLGPSGHTGFFNGVDYKITQDTIWFHGENDESKALEFEKDNFWYKRTIEMAHYLVKEADGDFFVSMPDNCGNADVLVAVHGAEKVLMDMFTDEEYIQLSLDKIQKVWKETTDDVYNLISKNNENGSGIGWLFTWAPGKHAQMQCDMSAMISPQLYEKYILQELKEQAKHLDYSMYHLDGSEQLRHLDLILSIDELDAIQWTSVAGQPSAVTYIDSLQKIQAAGKGLHMHMVNLQDVETLMTNLSSKGLHITTVVPSEDEAKSVVKMVEKLTHD